MTMAKETGEPTQNMAVNKKLKRVDNSSGRNEGSREGKQEGQKGRGWRFSEGQQA